MNNIRRKELRKIAEQVDTLRSMLEELMEEEEEYRDNIPENLQGSERYEKADEACYALEDAVSSLEEVVENIENACE